MRMSHSRLLNLATAFLLPPLVMTLVAVALDLTFGGDSPPWTALLSAGFYIVLIPGFYFLAREVRPLERPVRGLVIALVYFYVMFWVTVGSAFYLGLLILSILHPHDASSSWHWP